MRAIVQTRYGSPDDLELRELDVPTPGERDVLVRVHAASVHADVWHMITGEPRVLRLMGGGLRAPAQPVPGTDLAGVVEAIGPGVVRFRPGDEVFGKTVGANSWRNGGAYAEFATAPEDRLEPKPTDVSFVQAAASPDAGTIALQGIHDEGRIRPGHRVLINGAGGGVGSFAVQIAKALGSVEVTGVDLAAKLDLVRSIGADRTIDPASEDFTRTSTPYDLILDIPGNRSFGEIKRALTPDGTYVLIGHDAYGRADRRWIGSFGRFAKLTAMAPFEKQLPGLRAAIDPGDRLRVVAELLEAGSLVPAVDRTYPLEEVADAIRYLATGAVKGKLVITIGP